MQQTSAGYQEVVSCSVDNLDRGPKRAMKHLELLAEDAHPFGQIPVGPLVASREDLK